MHAHWIEVFNGANDDDVVVQVTHHLELELFPTQNRFLDQDLVDWRGRQATPHDLFKLLRVESGTASRAPEGKARPDDCRVPRLFHQTLGVRPRVGESSAR